MISIRSYPSMKFVSQFLQEVKIQAQETTSSIQKVVSSRRKEIALLVGAVALACLGAYLMWPHSKEIAAAPQSEQSNWAIELYRGNTDSTKVIAKGRQMQQYGHQPLVYKTDEIVPFHVPKERNALAAGQPDRISQGMTTGLLITASLLIWKG